MDGGRGERRGEVCKEIEEYCWKTSGGGSYGGIRTVVHAFHRTEELRRFGAAFPVPVCCSEHRG